MSDPEMEPHYECDLCGNQVSLPFYSMVYAFLNFQGIANGMFSHLMGQKHRQRFVEDIHKDNPARYLDLSQGELLKMAKKYAENDKDLNVIIKTRRSDEVG